MPEWARMDLARFKKRIAKQAAMGTTIEKYKAHDICMPESVELDDIFYHEVDKKDTSSLIWDTTKTFISY